jgi:signal peptidase II
MRPATCGFLVALATLVLDQATKLHFLLVDPLSTPRTLAPFLELIVVWNRGISYGLFQQHSELGRWLLVALSLAAALGLSLWLRRAATPFLAAALGLIVGGAVGNAADRVAYGAVFDFIHLHAGSFSWYVFNLADAAIVAGVAGLLYDALILERRRGRTAQAGSGLPKRP